jgi:phage/plasmid primase-like uncharacterized protein
MTDPLDNYRIAIQAAGLTPPEVINADGRIHRFSTNGLRGDLAGWYLLRLEPVPNGVFGCWRSGLVQSWRADTPFSGRLTGVHGPMATTVDATREYEREQHALWAKNAALNIELAAESEPAGGMVRRYLAARGLGDWVIPACIRQHPALPYWQIDDRGRWRELGRFPAMLAPVMLNGQVVAYHRTYLGDGCKADVPQPKKLTRASGPLRGACIPLALPHDGVLGVAEGIETAAAAGRASGLPVVAAYSACALSNFIWPKDVEHIVIFADNDASGLHAAGILAARVKDEGLSSATLAPSEPGWDWADVWKGVQA